MEQPPRLSGVTGSPTSAVSSGRSEAAVTVIDRKPSTTAAEAFTFKRELTVQKIADGRRRLLMIVLSR